MVHAAKYGILTLVTPKIADMNWRRGRNMKMKLQTIGIVVVGFLFIGGTVFAIEPRQATIFTVSGDVLVRQDSQDWQPAKVGMTLNKNDEIKTSEGGFAEVLLDDGRVGSVQIHPKSLFKLESLEQNGTTGEKHTLLNLAIGKVLVHAEKLHGNSTFEVRTPTSTTGVRGTMFEVSVE